jgi:OMF family outer membrane factor
LIRQIKIILVIAIHPTAPAGQFKEAQFGVPHNLNLNVQFTMPLFNAQILGDMKTTNIGTDMSKLQQQKTEEQVYFDISNLYYNAQILQKQKAFIDSNLVNTNRLLQNMQLLREQDMLKSSYVTKVELQKAQLQTQLEIVGSKIAQVINALKFSMGIPITQEIEIHSAIEFKNNADFSSKKTIDIQLVETQNMFLKSELSTLKNSRLPSLSLYGTYGQTGFGYDEKPNDFLKFFPVSFVDNQFHGYIKVDGVCYDTLNPHGQPDEDQMLGRYMNIALVSSSDVPVELIIHISHRISV